MPMRKKQGKPYCKKVLPSQMTSGYPNQNK